MKIQTFDGLEGDGETAAEAFADLARKHALHRTQAECEAEAASIMLGPESALVRIGLLIVKVRE